MTNKYSNEVLYFISKYPAFILQILLLVDSKGEATGSLRAFIANLENEEVMANLESEKIKALEEKYIENLNIEDIEAIQDLIAENIKFMHLIAEKMTENMQVRIKKLEEENNVAMKF